MKKTLTNVKNEAQKDDPSWKMPHENPMCVCLFIYLLNENKSTMLTTNKDEEEKKQKESKRT